MDNNRVGGETLLCPPPEGLPVRVEAECKEGDYRAAWHAWGNGPAPDGKPFDYIDGDFWPTPVEAADCEQ
ncbi:MAG: hypothetical protein LC799_34510 [Actinobacteria bacterium]|nr:hypothetical protein [Actinomycetota bacterium]